jgi:chromate reductase
MSQIAIFVGSLRKDSINRKLAAAMARLAPPSLSFTWPRIDDLPLYNQDDDASPHANVVRLKREIAAAQGVIFVTPEYNRSIPGVLKNAIDHASRPYGQSAWAGKPAGVIGASIGAPGAAMAQQHLRNVLAYLDVPALAQPEVFVQVTDGMFDEQGNLAREDTKKFLQGWIDRYVSWIALHSKAAQ